MLGKMSEYMLKHMSWNVMVGITRNKIFSLLLNPPKAREAGKAKAQ